MIGRKAPPQHILYVEDDPDIQKIARVALEAIGGFTVHACLSGEKALELVRDGLVPDLLLLDVMMPRLNGPDTLRALRALPATASTPAIFITAKVQAGEVSGYEQLGALAVISKPFDPLGLAQRIRDVWERAQP